MFTAARIDFFGPKAVGFHARNASVKGMQLSISHIFMRCWQFMSPRREREREKERRESSTSRRRHTDADTDKQTDRHSRKPSLVPVLCADPQDVPAAWANDDVLGGHAARLRERHHARAAV